LQKASEFVNEGRSVCKRVILRTKEDCDRKWLHPEFCKWLFRNCRVIEKMEQAQANSSRDGALGQARR
jgi:hypothetical protein